MGLMELEQALAKIKEQETTIEGLSAEVTGLKDEKNRLLAKRDELLGKVAKFKKFEAHADLDIDELLQIKQRYEELETSEKSKYADLYQKDKSKLEQRLEAIEQERAAEKEERAREKIALEAAQLRTEAIGEFAKPEHGVFDPEQLFTLVGHKIRRNEEGKIIAGDEYKSFELGEFVKELKEQPRYLNQFKPNGASGSGALPSPGGGRSPIVNPFKPETFNLTEQMRLRKENPAEWERLRAAAGVK